MYRITATSAVLFMLTACASNPPNEMLNEAQAEYDSARIMSGIHNAAATNMDAAGEALSTARKLHKDNASESLVNHHALLATKESEIAKQKLQIRTTKQAIDDAKDRRQRLLLEARMKEADAATREAKHAEHLARIAQAEAAAAGREAEIARKEAAAAREKLRSAENAATKMASELEDLKAKQSERGLVLTLEDIVFDLDSAELQTGGERTVHRIGEFLNEYTQRKVLIEGHTDSSGSEQYNQGLSEQRANAVREALIRFGVNGDRLSTKGLGEQYPLASNDSTAGRQQNRRVELIVSNVNNAEVESR